MSKRHRYISFPRGISSKFFAGITPAPIGVNDEPKELEKYVEKILRVTKTSMLYLCYNSNYFQFDSEEKCKEFSNKLGIEIHPDSEIIDLAKKLGNL